MNLHEYHKKRDFTKTREPRGRQQTDPISDLPELRFSVQKHDARSLHYDLRLEQDGVLKSWAVPKGPNRDPNVKRLAIETEDHPIEYLLFEGVIPEGEYGGGTVLVWDTGTWKAIKGSLKSGRLKFQLRGHRLNGAWQLIRTQQRGEGQWLLHKIEDDEAAAPGETPLTESETTSVLTSRTLEQVAADRDSVWSGDTSETTNHTQLQDRIRSFLVNLSQPSETNSKSAQPDEATLSSIPGSRPAPFPSKPPAASLPTAANTPPSGSAWVHEIKYDGYRMMCCIDNQRVSFISRNGKDWTDKLPYLARTIASLGIDSAILDGEIAAVTSEGHTDFQTLQSKIGNGQDKTLQFFVFDIIYCGGFDLTHSPLLKRKEVLQQLLPPDHPSLNFSEHISGQGDVVFAQASKLGAEGIVCKKADSRYIPGRTDVWLKVKSFTSSEFVVGGFTVSDTAHRGIRALVLGRYEGGQLIYEGRVGTGFTTEVLADLESRLTSTRIELSPFENLDKTAGREYRWVEPKIVVEVRYGGWTNDALLRFPSYRGERPEVDAQSIVRSSENSADIRAAQSDEEADTDAQAEPATPMEVDFDDLRDFRLTNPERVVYPEDGVSKLGLATYFGRIAAWMLPHLIDRPLALVRCPKGTAERCFFQKKPLKGMPASILAPVIEMEGRTTQTPPMVNGIEGLMALIQFGTVEIHTWGCLADRPDRPDAIIFDLDPDESVAFSTVAQAALMIRTYLHELDLDGYVKTTGGKGLHVVLPIRRTCTWSEVEVFCNAMSRRVTLAAPGQFTTSPSKSARKGKIYIDTLRNRFGATSIAPFSTRAKDTATISVPVEWDEIPSLMSANGYSVENIFNRIENLQSDPWHGFYDRKLSLTKSLFKTLPDWSKGG